MTSSCVLCREAVPISECPLSEISLYVQCVACREACPCRPHKEPGDGGLCRQAVFIQRVLVSLKSANNHPAVIFKAILTALCSCLYRHLVVHVCIVT